MEDLYVFGEASTLPTLPTALLPASGLLPTAPSTPQALPDLRSFSASQSIPAAAFKDGYLGGANVTYPYLALPSQSQGTLGFSFTTNIFAPWRTSRCSPVCLGTWGFVEAATSRSADDALFGRNPFPPFLKRSLSSAASFRALCGSEPPARNLSAIFWLTSWWCGWLHFCL